VICCAEEEIEHVALPRGCLADLRELLGAHDSQLVVEDRRTDGQSLDVCFQGTLTAEQQKAANALEGEEIGVLVAPPGAGKTVVGIHLIARRARNTLVLVHRQQLLDQWRSRIAMFLGIELSQIGQIGGGKRKPTGQIDVAMIQSLVRRGDVADLIAEYGHVVVDECHHIPAPSFERLLGEAHARFVTGLTATPRRRDGHHPITEMQLGPVRYTVDQRKLAASRPFDQKLVLRHTEFRYETEQERPPIQDVYRAMVDDPGRNQLLLDDIIRALEEGRSPIVLTERTAHLEFLKEQLQGFARNTIVLRGGRTSKQRRVALEVLAAVPADEERLILATGRFIGEGFDDDRLDTLFLVMPISWKGTLIQYSGRLHRLHPAKREVRIYDYVDRHVPMLARMADKRLRGYRSIGYEVIEGASESTSERSVPSVESDEPFEGDAVIEWDLEALRALEWDE
jgi:superfamily II DNA or RNA helicase